MKIKINDTVVKVLLIDYLRARRINKYVTECLELVNKYNLKDTLNIEIEYSPNWMPPYVILKYNKPYPAAIEMYDFLNRTRGYYMINGDRKFNTDSFYMKVIKPHVH